MAQSLSHDLVEFSFFLKKKKISDDEICVENVGQRRAVGNKVAKKKGKFSGRVKTTDHTVNK